MFFQCYISLPILLETGITKVNSQYFPLNQIRSIKKVLKLVAIDTQLSLLEYRLFALFPNILSVKTRREPSN